MQHVYHHCTIHSHIPPALWRALRAAAACAPGEGLYTPDAFSQEIDGATHSKPRARFVCSPCPKGLPASLHVAPPGAMLGKPCTCAHGCMLTKHEARDGMRWIGCKGVKGSGALGCAMHQRCNHMVGPPTSPGCTCISPQVSTAPVLVVTTFSHLVSSKTTSGSMLCVLMARHKKACMQGCKDHRALGDPCKTCSCIRLVAGTGMGPSWGHHGLAVTCAMYIYSFTPLLAHVHARRCPPGTTTYGPGRKSIADCRGPDELKGQAIWSSGYPFVEPEVCALLF